MVVEFIGLPACGKSYLSDYIKKNEKRINSFDFSEKMRTESLYKLLAKLIRVYTYINPTYRKYRKGLKNILADYNNIKAKYEIVYTDCFIDDILMDIWVYGRYSNRDCLLIFSEGIAQALVNIVTNFDVPGEKIKDMIEYLKLDVKTLYIKNSVQDSIDSIISRDRHVCYIDELRGIELENFLNTYNKNCEIVGGILKAEYANKYDNTEETSKKIMEMVELN